jgi:lipoprotein signal peptidase
MNYLLVLIVGVGFGLTLILDQLAKAAAASYPPGFRRPLGPWLEFAHVRHATGNSPLASPLLLAIITSVLILYGALQRNALLLAAVAVAVGGAISNYLSRRSPAGVVNCFSFRKRLAFNLADLAITAGACVASVIALLTLVLK